jgi:hypothetical protein
MWQLVPTTQRLHVAINHHLLVAVFRSWYLSNSIPSIYLEPNNIYPHDNKSNQASIY